MEPKKCIRCGTEFFKGKGKGAASNFKKKKFCSHKCSSEHTKGRNLFKRNCVICEVEFSYHPYRTDAKCCSVRCAQAYRKTDEFRENLSQKHTGKEIPDDVRKKISEAQKGKRTGKDNHLWKGDDVGYRAMHEWIRREKGTPKNCEHCGTDKRRLVWANKSHEYRREVDDWMRLCYPCHRRYDFPNEKHRNYD